MPDLREWIEDIKRADPPDLWGDLERRAVSAPSEPERRWVRPARAAAVLIASIAVVGSALWGLNGLRTGPEATSLAPGETVRYQLDGAPEPIAIGEGAAWVHVAGDGDTSGLVRIDAETGAFQSIDTPGGEWPAVGGGSAWLLCNSPACHGGSVLQIDPLTGKVIRMVATGGRAWQIAGTSKGVWITSDSGVTFVNSDGVAVRTFEGRFNLVGTDGTSLWVSTEKGAVALDPADGHEITRVPFGDVCTMEVAAGKVWIASCDGGLHEGNDGDELLGVDAVTGEVLFRETLDGYGQMRYADGVLWLAQNDPNDEKRIRLLRFDPMTGAQVAEPIEIEKGSPQRGGGVIGFAGPHVFFAVGEGSLWLTDFSSYEVIRLGLPLQPTFAPSPEPRSEQSTPPSFVVEEALFMASSNGDPSPISAEWVLSDAQTIAPAVGLSDGDPSQKEYLVVLHGNFTAYMAKVPNGAPLPKGTILVFALDPNTHQVLDWGVSNTVVDIPGLQPFELRAASPG